MMSMTTKRARQHQWIVLRQKAFRHFKRHRGSYYKVQDSIDKYGEHPLEPIEDERFHDTQSMWTYALTQLQPEPTLTVEVTTYTHMKPISGDKIHCYVLNNRLMGGPRWRAIGRVQTEYERMVPVLHPTRRNLPQGKTEPLGLLQFVTAPFDPDPFEPFWTTKEDER